MAQMQNTSCSYMWCGMITNTTFSDLSTTLIAKVPSPLAYFVTFSTYPELFNKIQMVMYCAVLIVPVLVLLLSVLCMV